MNGAGKPKLQFGGTVHVENPTEPVGNVGAPANVMPAEQAGPSRDEINAILLPVSQQHGYCLCLHPFQQIIDFTGTTCAWCSQPLTADQYTPESKEIRTAALHAAYPPGHPYRTDGSAPSA